MSYISYDVFSNEIKNGGIKVPPILQIIEIAINKYGKDFVDVFFEHEERVRSKKVRALKSLIEHSLYSKEFYNSIMQDFPYNEDTPDYKKEFYLSEIFEDDYDYYIIVRYPLVEIVNSRGNKHTLRDVFIRHNFYSSGVLKTNFGMTRTTFTPNEIGNMYLHSHHSSITSFYDITEFKTTCLGSGVLSSEINTLKVMSARNFDPIRILGYFANVDSYIGWESLEGGPYRRISEIGTGYSSTKISMNEDLTIDRMIIGAQSRLKFANQIIEECSNLDDYFTVIPKVIQGTFSYKVSINWDRVIEDSRNSPPIGSDPSVFLYMLFAGIKLYRMPKDCLAMYHKDSFNNPIFKKVVNISDSTAERVLESFTARAGSAVIKFKGNNIPLVLLNTDPSNPDASINSIIAIHPYIFMIIAAKLEYLLNIKLSKNEFNLPTNI